MALRYSGDAFSYFDVMPQEVATTQNYPFRPFNDPSVYTSEGVMNPELLQKLAKGQTPAGEGRGIMDLLKSGAGGVRDLFLEGVGAMGGLNIGAQLGATFSPALALPEYLSAIILILCF